MALCAALAAIPAAASAAISGGQGTEPQAITTSVATQEATSQRYRRVRSCARVYRFGYSPKRLKRAGYKALGKGLYRRKVQGGYRYACVRSAAASRTKWVFNELGRAGETGTTSPIVFPSTLSGTLTIDLPSPLGEAGWRMKDVPNAKRQVRANGVYYSTAEYDVALKAGIGNVKESIIVHKRQGVRTWTWQLHSDRGTAPALKADGTVTYGNDVTIHKPVLLNASGRKLRNLQWKLSGNTLSLTVNDTGLRLPYIVDPSADYPAVLFFDSVQSGTVTGAERMVTTQGAVTSRNGTWTEADIDTNGSVLFDSGKCRNGGGTCAAPWSAPMNLQNTDPPYGSGSVGWTQPAMGGTTINGGTGIWRVFARMCYTGKAPSAKIGVRARVLKVKLDGAGNITSWKQMAPWSPATTGNTLNGNGGIACGQIVADLTPSDYTLSPTEHMYVEAAADVESNAGANSGLQLEVSNGGGYTATSGIYLGGSNTNQAPPVPTNLTVAPAPNALGWINSTSQPTFDVDPFADVDSWQNIEYEVCSNATCSTIVTSGQSATGEFGDTNTSWQSSSLAEGIYWVRARTRETSGQTGVSAWSATVQFNIDRMMPGVPASVADGTGADATYIASLTTLSANWPAASDGTGSGIGRYEYCISTTTNCSAPIAGGNWQTNALSTSFTKSGLTLVDGTTYYTCVRTFDNAGNASTGMTCSNGQTPELSPPTLPAWVNDSLGVDSQWTNSPNTLSANWDIFTDSISGPQRYEFCISTTTNCGAPVVGGNWQTPTPTPLTQNMTTPGLALVSGQIYFTCVRTFDRAGNMSVGMRCSNGQTVDLVRPNLPAAVRDGVAADIQFTNVNTTLNANWDIATDALSGLNNYEFCISTAVNCGGTVVQNWLSTGTTTSGSWTGAARPDGIYYTCVRTVDRAGNSSLNPPACSNGQTIETLAPTVAFNSFQEPIATPWAYWSGVGSRLWFNPNPLAPQNLDVVIRVVDPGSGPDRVVFTGFGAGNWTPIGGGTDLTEDAPVGSGLYRQNFGWSSPAGDPALQTATGFDRAGNSGTASFDVDPDSTKPINGAVDYTDGFTNAASLSVALTPATDGQSGIDRWELWKRTGTLNSGGGCSGWSAWAAAYNGAGNPPATQADATVDYTCYEYQLTIYDRVNNSETFTIAKTAKVDRTRPTGSIAGPAGPTGGTIVINGTGVDTRSGVNRVELRYSGPASGSVCLSPPLTPPGAPDTWTYACSWNTAAPLLPDGTYTLDLIVWDNAGNQSITSSIQRTIVLDNNPPDANFDSYREPVATPWAHWTGGASTTLWYNPNPPSPQSADLLIKATDLGVGMRDVTFPNFALAGWSAPAPAADATVEPVDLFRTTYTFSAGAANPPTQTAIAYDLANNPRNVTFEVEPDSTKPAGATITYTNGWSSAASNTVNLIAATDAQSGIDRWELERRSGALSGGSCTFGGWGVAYSGAGAPPATQADPAADGTCYEYRLVVYDKVNNFETFVPSVASTTRVDRTRPTGSIGGPAGPSSGTIVVDGTGFDGMSGVNRVELRYSGPASGSVCLSPPLTPPGAPDTWTFACSWNTAAPLLPDGTYTLNLVVWDNAGNQSVALSIQRTIVLDNNPPLVTHSSWIETSLWAHWPGAGDRVWFNPNPPAPVNVDVVIHAGDAGVGMDRVDFPVVGEAGWSTAGVGGFTQDPLPAPVGDGMFRLQYTFAATAADPVTYQAWGYDRAGNSAFADFNMDPDSTAPNGGSISYTNGWSSAASNTVNLNSGTDAQSGIDRWELERRTGTLGGGVCSAWSAFTIAYSGAGNAPATQDDPATDGTCYEYQLVVYDKVNNSRLYVPAIASTTRVDRTRPTGTIAGPASPSNGTIVIDGSGFDAMSGVQKVELRYSGPASGSVCLSPALTPPGAPDTWTYACTWNTAAPLLPDGTYTLNLIVWDNAGNQSVVNSIQRTIVLDNNPPTVTFNAWQEPVATPYAYWSGAGNKLWFNPAPPVPQNVDLLIRATDLGVGVNRVTFADFALAGWSAPSPVNDLVFEGANLYRTSYTFSATAGDPPTQTATGVDNAGNSASVAFEVDADANVPVGGVVSYTNGYNPSTSITISLTQGSDADSGLARWELHRSQGTLSGGTCIGYGAFAPLAGASGAAPAPATYNDTTLVDGRCYQYRLVTFDRVNNSAPFGNANEVKLDLTPPTGSLVLAEATNPQYQYLATPTRLYVNSNQSGTFTADVTASAASGILDVNFPVLAANFSGNATDTTAPYGTTYSWSSIAGNPGTKNAVIRSNSLGALSLPFDVLADGAQPSGGSITYANVFQTTTTMSVAFVVGTDALSGVDTWELRRGTTALVNGTCPGAYGSWTAVGGTDPASPYGDSGLADGQCYKYELHVRDRVGNERIYSSANEVKVDQTAPTAASVVLSGQTNPLYSYMPTANTAYYNGNFAGSIRATVTATDAQSGIKDVDFPALGGGWDPGALTADAVAPYEGTYTWTAGDTSPGARNITARNNVNQTLAAGFTITNDAVKPDATGGSVSYLNGFTTLNSTDITFTNGAGDAGSGMRRRFLERRSVTYDTATGTCPTASWSVWAQIGGNDPTSPYTDTTLTQPTCYQYRFVEEDNVDNEQQYTFAGTVIRVDDIWPPAMFDVIDPTPAAFPAITTGAADPACTSARTYPTLTPLLEWNATTDAESGLAGYDVYVDNSVTKKTTTGPGVTDWLVAPALSEGAHTWGVRAFDVINNRRDSGPTFLRTIRVDGSAPVANNLLPANNSWTQDTTPTFSWSAADANCLARIEIIVDGVVQDVAGPGEVAWTAPSALASGNHTWQIRAWDSAGKSTLSPLWTVGIDVVQPTPFDLITPTSGQTVRGFVVVTWNASGDGESGLDKYEVWIDGVRRATVPAGTLTVTVSGITAGAHNVYVKALDRVGNSINSMSTRPFTGYGVIPSPVLISPAHLAAMNTVPTLVWNWPSDGGPAPTEYDVVLGSSVINTVTHPTMSDAIADPGDGTYTWRIVQRDPYTGTVTSGTRTFTIDRVDPTNPGPLTRIVTDVSWPAVTDDRSGVQKIEFWYDAGLGPVRKATLAASATTYDYGLMPDGSYQMWTRAFDRAGNTTDSPILLVTNDSVPPTPFTLIAPTNPVLPAITNGGTPPACAGVPTFLGTTPLMSWNASSDATSGMKNYQLFVDGSSRGIVADPGTSLTPTPIVGGTHTWYVVASDNFGLTRNSTPNPMTVQFDTAAPAVALTIPANNAYTNDVTPSLNWNPTDEACIARAQVYIDGVLQDTIQGGATAYSPAAPLTQGAHTWRVDVIDVADNLTASSTRTVNIDSMGPTGVTAIAPPNGGSVPEDMMAFSWTAASDPSGIAHYEVWIDGVKKLDPYMATSTGTYAIYAGAHTWMIRAFDNVGNSTDFNFNFTATPVPDVTPPTAFNLLTPLNGASIVSGTSLTWEPAFDFKGVDNYKVYIDGGLVASVPGTQTFFAASTGAGAPICISNFDPTVNQPGCIYAASYPAAWTIAPHGIYNAGGNSLGFDAFDGDRVTTASTHTINVPASGADLRFEHHFDNHATYDAQGKLQSAWDGGNVQVSTDNGVTWKNTCVVGARSKFGTSLQCAYEVMEPDSGYTGVLAGGTGNPLAYAHVFAGSSPGVIQSKLRLSMWSGQTIKVRFIQANDSCYVGMPAAAQAWCAAGLKKSQWQIDNLTLAEPALSPGVHAWNIVATDPAGNTRASNQTWNFNLLP